MNYTSAKHSGTNYESSDALPVISIIILASFMLLHRAGTLKLHQHKTELIVGYKIVAAASSEPKCSDSNSYGIEASDFLETKRSDSNSEKSDELPAIDIIILASPRVLHWPGLGPYLHAVSSRTLFDGRSTYRTLSYYCRRWDATTVDVRPCGSGYNLERYPDHHREYTGILTALYREYAGILTALLGIVQDVDWSNRVLACLLMLILAPKWCSQIINIGNQIIFYLD